MRSFPLCLLLASVAGWLAACARCPAADAAPTAPQPFGVEVVDEATGRGVPLVSLKTTYGVTYLTDSAGRVAFAEPGLLGQRVFFSVQSAGYEFPKDGFGYAGVALETRPGGSATLKLKRVNVAERLYRLTGASIYRDTMLLGGRAPVREPLLNGQVVGQDSTQAAVYRGRIHWFWGDTTPLKYPLGNFHTSGAVSELPGKGGLDPAAGVDFRYFTDTNGFCRAVAKLPGEGIVWLDGLLVVPDASGSERLAAHYSRRKSLETQLEHGLAVWDEAAERFEKVRAFPDADSWRCPQGQPVRVKAEGRDDFYFLLPDRAVRVPAQWSAVQDSARYEAFTCAAPAGNKEAVDRDAAGAVRWTWRTNAPPVSQADERRWLKAGALRAGEARYQFRDVANGQTVEMHAGSVRWNEYRRRWVWIGVQQGGTSFLGEVWYAEAASPTGPWGKARKIVTHDRYSFYNPVQHAFFDQAGGRFVYFEGTYAQTFSGNPVATPWYDYNQILYRLDLASAELESVRAD
jgi:hypothetical protein